MSCCGAFAQVEWTQELHERFVNAVETLGADKAVPSKILEHMGPIAVGLTRQNVASHLQKYRTRKRTQNDFCKAAAYCPPAAYQCWSPFSPPCAMIGAPLSFMAALQARKHALMRGAVYLGQSQCIFAVQSVLALGPCIAIDILPLCAAACAPASQGYHSLCHLRSEVACFVAGGQPHMMAGMPMCGMPAVAWPAATPMIPNPTPHPPLSATINAAIADLLARPKVLLVHALRGLAQFPHVNADTVCMHLESAAQESG